VTVRRAALLTLAAVFGVALLATAIAAWLLATGSGLRFVWNRAAGFVPGDVEIRALDGRLIGPVIVEGFLLSTENLRVTLERGELEWQPLALLARSFNADSLSLSGLDVVLIPAAEGAGPDDAEPFELPARLALPVNVNVETISVDDARVFTAPEGEPLVIDSARFSVHLDTDEWLLHELIVRAPLFDVDGRIETMPRGDYRSEAEIDWRLRLPDLPAASGSTTISGDATQLLVEQRVEPPYALNARMTIADPFGRLGLDGALELRVDPAELGFELPVGPVAATATLGGSIDDVGLSGAIDLPVPDLVDARVDFDARYADGVLFFDSLRVADTGSAAVVSLTGRAALSPAIDVELEGDWAALQWPPRGEPLFSSESGRLRLTGTPDDLTADLDAVVANGGSIEGTLRRAGERLAAELEWHSVAWPEDEPRVSSDSGMLTVDGVLDDYSLTVDAALAMSDGTAGHVRLAGTGSLRRLDLEQIDVAALEGTLTGRGSVEWDPALAAEIDLTASNIDPGIISPDWSGRVSGDVRGAAALDAGTLSARVEQLFVSGELRDRPMELDARGRFDADTAEIDAFTLRSGATTVAVNGTVGPQLAVEWRLDSPDLGDVWPDLGGRLTARGGASGPRLRPIVAIEADGAELDVLGIRLGTLTVAADVDAAGARESQLELALTALRFEDWELERLDLSGGGDANAHALSLSAAGEGGEADIELAGSFERPWQPDFAWRFDLERATLTYAELAPWSLREPSSGRATQVGIELERTCWQSGVASFCIDAAQQQSGTRARLAVGDLPFQYFASLFPDGVRMTGTVSAAGELALMADEPPRFEVDLTTSRGRVGSDLGDGGVAGLAFGSGAARIAWNGNTLEADLEWPFERQQGQIELNAAIMQRPGAPFTDSAIDGSLIVELRDLRFLADLVNGVGNTAGALSGDIGFTGTVAEPLIAGRLELTGGTARLRDPDIVLADLRVALVGDGSGGVAVEARGSSGGGSFEANGTIDLDASQPVGNLAISGSDFELFNTPDAQVFVSPDLRLELTPQRLQLTGDVVVPRARITPRGTTEGAIQASADQVFVDAEEERRAALTRALYAQVAIHLGDNVTFEGFGLTGRLAGALEVVEVPAEPTTGSGELRVENGTYVAYGQELEIRTGRLVFAGGALTRPGLDIEAVRRPAEDVLVGARVRGTLRQPELSVFSEPAMARQEQLSYLVLGRPLENASASENSALSQAAMALGLRGGNFVSDRLNRSLGFDEFGIQTQPGEDANAASFVIGKYLSPSLYVSYGVGLFQPVNTLRLRYTISSRWRLVTESSSRGSGGDLIYHIERGD
jgi:translocation and assembly module TamB